MPDTPGTPRASVVVTYEKLQAAARAGDPGTLSLSDKLGGVFEFDEKSWTSIGTSSGPEWEQVFLVEIVRMADWDGPVFDGAQGRNRSRPDGEDQYAGRLVSWKKQSWVITRNRVMLAALRPTKPAPKMEWNHDTAAVSFEKLDEAKRLISCQALAEGTDVHVRGLVPFGGKLYVCHGSGGGGDWAETVSLTQVVDEANWVGEKFHEPRRFWTYAEGEFYVGRVVVANGPRWVMTGHELVLRAEGKRQPKVVQAKMF